MKKEDLRPVEVLYLMEKEQEENADKEEYLASVLVSLSMKGYLKPKTENKGFEIIKEDENLRDYEKDIIRAIKEGDDRKIMSSVVDYNFKNFFIKRGLLKIITTPKKWWIFNWEKKEIIKTDLYYKKIEAIKKLKEELLTLSRNKKFEENKFLYSYSFPSLKLDKKFLKYAKEIKDNVEDITSSIAATNTAIIAAAGAASAASSAAACASSCSAASCSAGACGG